LVVLARLRVLGSRRVAGFVVTWLAVIVALGPWLGVWRLHHDPGRMIGRPGTIDAPVATPPAAEEAAVDTSSAAMSAAAAPAAPDGTVPTTTPANFDPRLRGDTTMPLLAIPYTFYAFAVGFGLGPTPAQLHLAPRAAAQEHWLIVAVVAVVFGGLAVIGLWSLLRRRPVVAAFLLVWIAVPFALTAWMAAANVKVWNARYVAVTFPAFLLLVGAGLGGLQGRRRLAVIAVILALFATSLWNLRRDPAYGKEDNRSAAAYLDHAMQADDALIGIDASLPVFYYTESAPAAYLHLLPHLYLESEMRRRIGRVSAGRDRVWLLRARAYHTDPTNRVGAILAETRTLAERVTFTGIELERYDRRGEAGASGDPGESGGRSESGESESPGGGD
jgi:hypothetical protein